MSLRSECGASGIVASFPRALKRDAVGALMEGLREELITMNWGECAQGEDSCPRTRRI